MYLIFTLIFIASDYFTNEGINDAVIYHVLYGLDGAGFAEYLSIIVASIVMFIFSFIFSYTYYKIINRSLIPKPKKVRKLIALVFIFLAFLTNPSSQALWKIYSNQITNAVSGKTDVEWTQEDNEFLSYYKTNEAIEIDENHPNFIYIYVESLEDTYFDENIFPDLMTGLKKIKEENTYFTNIHQISGSGWTVAGMTSSQCGIPLYTPSGGNSMKGMNNFYSGARCLGDFLSKEKYHLAFRSGTSLEFAGNGELFQNHGFSDSLGFDMLSFRTNGMYKTSWGLYDDDLLDIVYDDFIKLSKSGKKFGLIMPTMDTHHPKGHPSRSCKKVQYKDGSNAILNAVKCSDQLITEFIRKIQLSEYGANTIIILSSDHLAMKNTATDLLDKGDRKNLLVIIDPRSKTPKKVIKNGAMIDVGTTLVRLLGYDNDIGLGRNLLDNTRTLYDQFENIDKQLNSWSSSIRKFWNFAKLSDTIKINYDNKTIALDTQSYSFPIVLTIDKNLQTTPYFSSSNQAHEYLIDLNQSTSFIWVDKCKKTNILSGNFADKFCIAYGKLGNKITSIGLSKNYNLKTSSLISLGNKENIVSVYENNQHNLSHMRTITTLGNEKISYLKIMPKGSSIYVPEDKKTDKDEKLIAYYKSIGFDPFQNLSSRKEFYFFKLDKETQHLPDSYTIEVIAMKKWYYKYQNYLITHGYYDRKLRGSFFKATKVTLSYPEIDLINTQANIYATDKNRFIAHAGGQIEGHKYTNSLEAMDLSYQAGFRLFELDIIQTSDNIYVAAHDWKQWARTTGYQGTLPPDRNTFKEQKIYQKYSSMDMNDINLWFKNHPDAILVTDKVNTPIDFSSKFIDKNRLMMELFTWDAVKKGIEAKIKSSMPTGGILGKIKGNKVEYLQKLGITDIASSRRIINSQKSLVTKIVDAEINIYAFHLHFDKGKTEKYVVCEEDDYFYGMYADAWDFNTTIDCYQDLR